MHDLPHILNVIGAAPDAFLPVLPRAGEPHRLSPAAFDIPFAGDPAAVLALSGDLNRAVRLEDSCFSMWVLNGIEPELIDYRTMEIEEPGYQLRPEIVESAYYLHHFTGDPKYIEMGKTIFEDLVRSCRTEHGYAVLESVVSGQKCDLMPSYFLFGAVR